MVKRRVNKEVSFLCLKYSWSGIFNMWMCEDGNERRGREIENNLEWMVVENVKIVIEGNGKRKSGRVKHIGEGFAALIVCVVRNVED